MSTTTIEYGPYTPQEADRISTWLKNNQIPFVLEKDEEAEKLAMMNDGQNLVTRAEYRTQTYLGQIFYLSIDFPTPFQKDEYDKLFGLKAEAAAVGMAGVPNGGNEAAYLEQDDQKLLQEGKDSAA